MSNQLIDLTGKVAVITGASSGIGAETCILFSKLGAKVVASGRNNINLNTTIGKCIGSSLSVHADVTVCEDRGKIINCAIQEFGRIDILVNCAGIIVANTLEDTTYSQFDSVFDVNVKSLFYLTQLAIPYLKYTRGNIVNVSSVNGLRAYAGVTAYNMTKAAVDHLTRSCAMEVAKYGVRVNAVNPGVIVTDIHLRGGMSEEKYAIFLQRCEETHPLGRTGNVTEVANAIAFLASEAASYITGVTLPVDGGRHALGMR